MAEDVVKEIKKEESKAVKELKKNPWIAATFVFAIIALILLFVAFRSSGGGASVSKDVIGPKAVDFINTQLLQGQGTVTLDSVAEKAGLYEVTVDYQSKKIPVYFTKDGEYYVSTMILPLNTTISTGNSTTPTTPSGPVDIPIGDSPVIGNKNANVTIVEFSDFSCPYCGATSGETANMVAYMKSNDPSWQPAVPGIMKDYVNTGKAMFVYKYSIGHTGAKPATLVAFCLNDQNLFWKFHDKVYVNQTAVENLDAMKVLAKSLGADMTKLQSCLDSKKYDSKLTDDEALGQSIGIGGTPAIYANGVKVANGAESYTSVKAAIDNVFASLQ